jgi:hypothetical protein
MSQVQRKGLMTHFLERLTIVQAMDGSIARREVCESDVSNAMRDCTDWDTGAKYRDMKNVRGDWVQAIE